MNELNAWRTAPLIDHRLAAVEEVTFEELRESALGFIQRTATTWTDHNFHDPGITLLEAGLWGVADLFYRVDGFVDGAVPQDLEWTASVPMEADVGTRLVLAQTLLDRFADLTEAVLPEPREPWDAPPAAADAGQRLTGLLGSILRPKRSDPTAPRPLPGEPVESMADVTGPEAIHFLGHRLAAAEFGRISPGSDRDALLEVIERRTRRWLLHDSFAILRGALERGLGAAGVGPVRERLEAAVRLATEQRRSRRVRQATDQGWDVEATAVHGLVPGDSELATLLARLDLDVDPGWFEDEQGQARVWPPHPSQVSSADPFTGDDHLTTLHQHFTRLAAAGAAPYAIPMDGGRLPARPGRLWAVPGAIAGQRWDGRAAGGDDSLRPGALSLLVESCPGWSDDELLTAAREAFEQGTPRGYWGHRDFAALEQGGRQTLRPLGLELHFGLVRPVVVRISGTLEARAGAPTEVLRRKAQECLLGYLASGQPRDHAAPGSYATGWSPGAAVDLRQIEELLLDIDRVERVAFLRVQVDRGQAPSSGHRLLPFEVPDLERADLSGLDVIRPSLEDFDA
ncbi:hypothetical protein [Engelhardtia mirabilis]|uniref:Baseplate J-like protein n=1 Tax=Engelhardtia mirabilis TaxID=2528011 RepID=A0A518BPM2_9BACT|nr:hypothetical protein Pla133_40460 [Planctomycetes bacterium Pla133]QDV03258.1 hypothetical protein Pla86_40450 [Planctomycetes bacterium Pla86]